MPNLMSAITELLGIGDGTAKLVSGSATAVKAVMDLTRKPNPDLAAIKAMASDAFDKAFEAQARQMQQQDRLMELERHIRKQDHFLQEAQRYALAKTELGGFVYALKPGDLSGEPAHDLCAACFDREVKSVLQPVDFNTLGCPTCGGKVLKPDGRSGVLVGPTSRENRFSGY